MLQAAAEERRLEARLAEMRAAQAAMLSEAVSTAEVMERLVRLFLFVCHVCLGATDL